MTTPAAAVPAAPDLGPLIATMREAVVAFHGPGNTIVSWNPGAEALFGYTAAEALGQGIEMLVPPEANAGSCAALCCFLHGKPPCARIDEPHQTFDGVHQDGRRLLLEASLTRLAGPDGDRYAVMVARDVSERRRLEAQLSTAEQIAGLGSYDIDLPSGVSHVSPGLLTIYGLPPEMASTETAARWEQVHPDDLPQLEASWQAVLAGGPSPLRQYRIIRTDGEVRTVRTASHAVRDAAGLPVRIVGTLTDITDAVASESRYRLLAENIGDIVVTTDAAGRVTYVSPSVEAVLGHPPARYLGQPLTPYFVREGGASPIRHADGRLLWLEATTRPLLDAAGQPAGTVASLRDVSERRRAEALVALQNDVLRAIAEGTALDLVLDVLTAGLTQLCGTPHALVLARGDDDRARMAATRGLPPSYMQGLEAAASQDSIDPAIRRPWQPTRFVVADVAASGLPPAHVANAEDHGLRAFWVEPVFDGGGRVIGVISLLFQRTRALDAWHGQLLGAAAHLAGIAMVRAAERALLTHQHEALETANQRLMQADRQKDEFVSVISHELRNPLNLISGYVQMLQQNMLGPLSDRQADAVAALGRGAGRMQALVDDLIDLARIEAGTLAVDPRPAPLASLVDEVLGDLAPRAAARGLALHATVPAGLVVPLDALRVGQVIENLVGNAIKFTPEGGQIEVMVEPREAAVRLAVHDTGCGVASADLPRLFERFQQAEGGLARRAEGVGLGLAIVKAIAEAHGGAAGAESIPGAGSTFWIELPRTARCAA